MSDSRVIDAIKSANYIVRELLAIKPGEEVLLIADPETNMKMVHALAGIVQAVGAEYTIAVMPSRPLTQSLSVPKFIETGLDAVDVVIGMTRASGAACYNPRYAELRKKKKIRMLSMVLRDLDNWTKGGATADYRAILNTAKRLQPIWQRGEKIHITSKKGTDLTAKIGNAPAFTEAGFATNPGEHSAFSDGEVSQGPNEGTAEGVVMVDGPIALIGKPQTPVRLEVKKGKVVSVAGDEHAAKQLTEIINSVKDADNFAEIGIGLNPNSLQNGNFEEEKKKLGTIHIAIGRNTGAFGGTVASMVHMDMIIYDATVKTDKDMLLLDGKLLV